MKEKHLRRALFAGIITIDEYTIEVQKRERKRRRAFDMYLRGLITYRELARLLDEADGILNEPPTLY